MEPALLVRSLAIICLNHFICVQAMYDLDGWLAW
jgi:hypothetical protein